MSYNFIIQYYQDTLNSADESSQKSDYMTKQNKRHHENNSTSIHFEKKHHKNNFTSTNLKKFS